MRGRKSKRVFITRRYIKLLKYSLFVSFFANAQITCKDILFRPICTKCFDQFYLKRDVFALNTSRCLLERLPPRAPAIAEELHILTV